MILFLINFVEINGVSALASSGPHRRLLRLFVSPGLVVIAAVRARVLASPPTFVLRGDSFVIRVFPLLGSLL